MAIITTIKRRVLAGKGGTLIKRVVIPIALTLLFFHFFVSPPSSDQGKPEHQSILPGEALDPIMGGSHFSNRREREMNENAIHKNGDHEDTLSQPRNIVSVNEKSIQLKFEDEQKVAKFLEDDIAPGQKPNPPKASASGIQFKDSDVPGRMQTEWSMAKANIPDREKVKFKGHAITDDTVTLTLMASADKVFMSINKKEIYRAINIRGLHTVVLNQYNGRVMAKRSFDTYNPGVEEEMIRFIDDVTPGRILVFATLDDVSSGFTWRGRNHLNILGSRFSEKISFRDMWAMVTRKDGMKIAETFSNVATADTGYEWGGPIFMRTDFDLEERPVECQWEENELNYARRKFCVRYEGYGTLCRCDVAQWTDILYEQDHKLHEELKENVLFTKLAVVILGTNSKPNFIYRALKTLHEAPGFNSAMAAIYMEWCGKEVEALARMFNVTVVQTGKMENVTAPARIRHQVQKVFRDIVGASFNSGQIPGANFAEYAASKIRAQNVLILEEDMIVSTDIFKYLHSVHPIFSMDPSVLAVSAFNYHSFESVVTSHTNSYRTSDIFNLALMLTEGGIQNVLVPSWPNAADNDTEWYFGLSVALQKGDSAIVHPELSRAKHTCYEGHSISGIVQYTYFKDHKISITTDYAITDEDVRSLVLTNYNTNLRKTLKESKALVFDFCMNDLQFGNDAIVVYVTYDGKNDSHINYVMKCLVTWPMFPIGGWHHAWQFHFHGHPLTVVAAPLSPYSSMKPEKYEAVTKPADLWASIMTNKIPGKFNSIMPTKS